MNNRLRYLQRAIAVLLLSSGIAEARMGPTYTTTPKPSPVLPAGVVTPSPACSKGTARAELDINNVRTLLLNKGDMFWDGSSPRYEVPKVTDPSQPRRHSLFSGAIWIGGLGANTNQQYVCGFTFGQSQTAYFPGPIDDATTSIGDVTVTTKERCDSWNHLFKVNATTVTGFRAYINELIENGATPQTIDIPLDQIPSEIRNWPAKGNPIMDNTKYPKISSHINFDLARFVDINGDGKYNPTQGDFPRLPGVTDIDGTQVGADQVVYWVTNDAGGNKAPASPSIGMEIHTEAFAYKASDPTNTMTFYRQKLINKGNITLTNTYFAEFIDPDLGNPNDDYVGCDVERGLGICYNGDNDDEGVQGYGENPPTIAVDFFRGAKADINDGVDNDRDCMVDEDGELIMMSSFAKFNNESNNATGDPKSPEQFYNFLRGLWGDGAAMTYDFKIGRSPVSAAAPKTNFIFPGSSDLTRGWSVGGTCQNPLLSNGQFTIGEWSEATVSDNPFGDRRFVSSGGPFTLTPGSVNELTIGIVWAKASSGGALGSYNLLMQADDIAQKRFDSNFTRLAGPNAPDMEITELDGELILSLTPDEFILGNTSYTTESYMETDSSLRLDNGDINYHFQGYLVYQLANSTVPDDLSDATQARLIMQCDVKDGVTKIINQRFDYDIDAVISELKVNGEDKGIKPYIRLLTDAFTGSKLINHKKYYFHVIAYAYNNNKKNDTKFLTGNGNLGVYSAIPHKINSELFGSATTVQTGYELPITRIAGVGNGGTAIDLVDADREAIASNNKKEQLTYKMGSAPISIKVYDPKAVTESDFKLQITSRLSYELGSRRVSVGDTLLSELPYATFSKKSVRNGDIWTTSASPSFKQSRGKAVVLREVSSDGNIVNLDVKLLNGEVGGTFVVVGEKRQNKVVGSANKAGQFSDYIYTKGSFSVIKKNTSDTLKNVAIAQEFVTAEYITLKDITKNTSFYLKKTMSISGDEVVPAYGLAITINNLNSPGERVFEDYTNGYLSSSYISVSDQFAYDWLVSVTDADNGGTFKLIKRFDASITTEAAASEIQQYDDPAVILGKIMGGSFFPYSYGTQPLESFTDGGSSYLDASTIASYEARKLEFDTLNNRVINNLGNVDIVLTNDTSKWSRVVVIQAGDRNTNAKYKNFKSTLRSLDINFNVDASNPTSTGMSWFPGYAVDIDKGIRLNMMFAESAYNDKVKGNNLKWEPSSDITRAGDKSYIYIVPTLYDKGATMEAKFDSTYNATKDMSNVNNAAKLAINSLYMKNISWVGALALLDNPLVSIDYTRSKPLPSDAIIRLRVKKSYAPYTVAPKDTSAAIVPTYLLSTKGLAAKRNQKAIASSALDLIRVVPNPYYAYSSYEKSQVDNRVKITNLPTKCRIRIYNLGGSLIRQFNIDYSNVSGKQQWSSNYSEERSASSLDPNRITFQDWDLKNEVGIPIASGVYIIHVDAGELGEKTIKWCGGVRPIDLDALQN